MNTAVGRDTLQRHFNEVRVSDQPADIQHAIGVAFGRQAAGGFWNAYVVGLQPAAQAPDLLQFPVDYRLGLFEGMIIDQAGHIGLTVPYVEDLIGVLVPVPTSQAAPAVGEVAEKVRSATWITTWRGQTVDPVATIEALEREAARLERGTVDSLRGLKEALTVVSEPSQ